MRRAGRWLGVALVVCGLLLLAEVVATLVWKEPIGALRSDRGPRAELRVLTAAPSAAAAQGLRGPVRVAADAGAQRQAAQQGRAAGELTIPRLKLNAVLINGSAPASLARGPALYDGSPFPGERGTVAIAGHRTTHGAPFGDIDRLGPGDRITIDMPYARLTYVVRATRIVAPTDVSVLRGARGSSRLVLSACHPRFSAKQRIVVIAAPVDSRPQTAARG